MIASMAFLPVQTMMAAEVPLRVAVVAGSSAEDDLAVLMMAEISKIKGVELVERENIEALRGEQVLSVVAGERNRLALGRILAVDGWLLMTPEEGGVGATWIDGKSGEVLKKVRGKDVKKTADALMPVMKEAEAKNHRAPRVAVRDGSGSVLIRQCGALLRHWLLERGVKVLDRTLTLQVLQEREDARHGFVQREGNEAVFPGADYQCLLEEQAGGVVISVMGSNGQLVGVSPVWESGALSVSMAAFLNGIFDSDPVAEAATYRQRVGLEALQPYYRGVALFEAGKPIEATAEFQRAYEANNSFVPAYLWEARCYEVMGLPGFANAMRRFVELGFAGKSAAAGADTTPRDGVTFLGVTAEREADEVVATMLSLEAVRALSGPDLMLPESLGALRDEYDYLARTTHTEGARWDTSSGFVSRFSLRAEMQPAKGEGWESIWRLVDTIEGTLVAERRFWLSVEARRWSTVLNRELRGWLSMEQQRVVRRPFKQKELVIAEVEIDQLALTALNHADRNVVLLKRLLSKPDHPAAIGGQFAKGSSEKSGLDEFLNFAKNEYLRSQLGEGHAMAPWLELLRIQTFLPCNDTGRVFTGEVVDATSALKVFSKKLPEHPARVFAHYLYLFQRQAELPYLELAHECRWLLQRIEGQSEQNLPMRKWLVDYTTCMRDLALCSAGEPMEGPFPIGKGQHRLKALITPEGKADANWHEVWRVLPYPGLSAMPDYQRSQAETALAVQGRGDLFWRIKPEWMERFPNDWSVANFISARSLNAIHAPHYGDMVFPMDAAAERRLWSRQVDYAVTAYESLFSLVSTREEFMTLEAGVAYLPHVLHGWGFRDSMPKRRYDNILGRLKKSSADAAARLGMVDRSYRPREGSMTDWRELTWERAQMLQKDRRSNALAVFHYYDREELMAQEKQRARRAFYGEKVELNPWWRQITWNYPDAFSSRENAELFWVPHLPRWRQIFSKRPLDDDERAFLLLAGLALMNGFQPVEAEEFLKMVVDADASVGSEVGMLHGLQANGAFQLARLCHSQGRNTEAVSRLQACLDLTEGLEVLWLQIVGPDYKRWLLRPASLGNSLRSRALRLLEEIRFNAATARLPKEVKVLEVPTAHLDMPMLRVFYRLPKGELVKGAKPLMLCPSINQGVLELLEEGSSWVNFADQQGVVLVAPQFYQTAGHLADSTAASYEFPDLWSGRVILQIMEELKHRHEMDDQSWLLHGYGIGAQFLSRLARWAPERVQALSVHGAKGLAWEDYVPGLQSISALAVKPVCVSAGEMDDFSISHNSRKGAIIRFVSALKERGGNPEFHLLRGTAHQPTRELEQEAQQFFSKHLP